MDELDQGEAEQRLRAAMRELVAAYSLALESGDELPVVAIVVEELQAAGVELPAALTML